MPDTRPARVSWAIGLAVIGAVVSVVIAGFLAIPFAVVIAGLLWFGPRTGSGPGTR